MGPKAIGGRQDARRGSRQSGATLDVKIPRPGREHGKHCLNKCSGIVVREENMPKDP